MPYNALCQHAQERRAMPDDAKGPTVNLSFRVPADLLEGGDKSAGRLDRPRTWVIVRALRQYAHEGEGREILEETEDDDAVERGEGISADRVVATARQAVRSQRKARK